MHHHNVNPGVRVGIFREGQLSAVSWTENGKDSGFPDPKVDIECSMRLEAEVPAMSGCTAQFLFVNRSWPMMPVALSRQDLGIAAMITKLCQKPHGAPVHGWAPTGAGTSRRCCSTTSSTWRLRTACNRAICRKNHGMPI